MAETDTRYGACACSPLGKMVAQSLPYAYGGSPVWTAYTYDGSGRTVKSVKPDGSTTTYLYSGNNNTTTDPAGKWKPFTSDAFGDLIIVTEPDPASNTGGTVATNYTYNGASQLTQVSMPRGSITQTRTFTWSGSCSKFPSNSLTSVDQRFNCSLSSTGSPIRFASTNAGYMPEKSFGRSIFPLLKILSISRFALSCVTCRIISTRLGVNATMHMARR